jgi:hypothetical protein
VSFDRTSLYVARLAEPSGFFARCDDSKTYHPTVRAGNLDPFSDIGPPAGERRPKQANFAAKTRDEYRSAVEEFASFVKEPLETLRGLDVQTWIDIMLDPKDHESLDAVTANKKLSGLRSYLDRLRHLGLVDEERKPFHDRQVRNPPSTLRSSQSITSRQT